MGDPAVASPLDCCISSRTVIWPRGSFRHSGMKFRTGSSAQPMLRSPIAIPTSSTASVRAIV